MARRLGLSRRSANDCGHSDVSSVVRLIVAESWRQPSALASFRSSIESTLTICDSPEPWSAGPPLRPVGSPARHIVREPDLHTVRT